MLSFSPLVPGKNVLNLNTVRVPEGKVGPVRTVIANFVALTVKTHIDEVILHPLDCIFLFVYMD